MTSVAKLFFEIAPGQNRLGFLDADDTVLEVWFDALHRPNLMGTVHRARINRVFFSQNRATACLVDGEIISLRLRKQDMGVVVVGMVLPITITGAPRHGKPWQGIVGARLATKEMILLVGLPDNASVIQLSSQINADQRKNLLARLKAEVQPLMQSGFGVILRRGGTGLSDFSAAAKALVETWKVGTTALDISRLGIIFDAGNLLTRARRLVGNVTVIDNPSVEIEMSAILDEVISAACAPKWPLACGGHLWCEQTHAVWSIDLDTNTAKGMDQLFDEAAIEIAKQIRLRAMSGPVMLDVPRCSPGLANRFRSHLQKELDDDPRRPEYLGITRGGLIELRVPHGEMGLGTVMGDYLEQDALAGLRLVAQQPGFDEVKLAVSPAMAEWFRGAGQQALNQINRPLRLIVELDDTQYRPAHLIS